MHSQEEELEWFGLTIEEAESKQKAIERARLEAGDPPLKLGLMQKLLEEIKSEYLDPIWSSVQLRKLQAELDKKVECHSQVSESNFQRFGIVCDFICLLSANIEEGEGSDL